MCIRILNVAKCNKPLMLENPYFVLKDKLLSIRMTCPNGVNNIEDPVSQPN